MGSKFTVFLIAVVFLTIIPFFFIDVNAINVIKQVIKIEDVYPVNVASSDFTISPPLTNTSRAVAFLSFSHTGEADHSDTFRSWEIIDSDTLRIYGENTATGNNAQEFYAYIIEYEGDLNVHHSSRVTTASEAEGEKSVTIPTINTTNSFIVSKGHDHDADESSIGSEELDRIRILTSTSWGWLTSDTPNTGNQNNLVDVIDWNQNDIRVQRGTVTLADLSSTTTVTPPTTYDRNRTILLVTYTCNSGCATAEAPDDILLRATMNTSGQIVITRVGTEDGMQIAWELIEFPVDFIRVHYDSVTLAGGTAITTDTIPEVRDFDKSFVISTVGTPFGWGTGSTSSTVDGAIDRGMVDIHIINENSVSVERGDSTGTAIIEYQVIELLEPEFTELPHTQNVLKQIIKFEGDFGAGNIFQDYTVPEISNINKTIMFMSINSTVNAGSSESGKMWKLINGTTLRIFGSGTATNDPAHFILNIIEFNSTSPLFTQYDQLQYPEDLSDSTRTMWISPVNLTSSFILGQGSVMESPDPTFGSEEFSRVTLENGTRWQYETELAQDSVETTVQMMIVDTNNDNIRVQRGIGTMNSTTLNMTIIPPIGIERDQTFLLVNFKTTGAEFGEFPNRTAISATIDPSNNIILQREAGSISIDYSWQAVENIAGGFTVFHDIHHQEQGQSNETSTITGITNASNAFAIGTVSSYYTQTVGRGNSSETEFDTIFGLMKLEDNSTVRFTRGDSSGSWDVGFQVLEFFFTTSGITFFQDVTDTTATLDQSNLQINKTAIEFSSIVDASQNFNITKQFSDLILAVDSMGGMNVTKLFQDTVSAIDDVILNFLVVPPQPSGGGAPSSGGIQGEPSGTPLSPVRLIGLSIDSEYFVVEQSDVIQSNFAISWFGDDYQGIKLTSIKPKEGYVGYNQWIDFSPTPELLEVSHETGFDNRLPTDPRSLFNTALNDFTLNIPSNRCTGDLVDVATSNCFNPIVYEVPLEFEFDVKGAKFTQEHILTIDGREVPKCVLVNIEFPVVVCDVVDFTLDSWWALILLGIVFYIIPKIFLAKGKRKVRVAHFISRRNDDVLDNSNTSKRLKRLKKVR